jgi:hypothetical protein
MMDTRPGSPDGIQVNVYRAGEVYDLPQRLADVFLSDAACRAYPVPSAPTPEPAAPKAPVKRGPGRPRKVTP